MIAMKDLVSLITANKKIVFQLINTEQNKPYRPVRRGMIIPFDKLAEYKLQSITDEEFAEISLEAAE